MARWEPTMRRAPFDWDPYPTTTCSDLVIGILKCHTCFKESSANPQGFICSPWHGADMKGALEGRDSPDVHPYCCMPRIRSTKPTY